MNAPQRGDLSRLVSDPARSIARAAVASGLARFDRATPATVIAERTWPLDSDCQMILRGAVEPTDTASAAGRVQVVTAILPMLAPFSAAAQLFEAGLSVTMTRQSAGFVVPGMGLLEGMRFVREGAPKPVLQGAASGARLDPHKVAGIVVASSELFAQPSIEAIMQRLLSESAGQALDAIVFSADPGSEDNPPGLLAGIASIPPAAIGQDPMKSDLISLGDALAPVAGAGGVALIGSLG